MSTNLNHELERDGGAYIDPLEIAQATDVRAGESWVFLHAARGSQMVWTIGTPVRGLLIVSDSPDGTRECVRYDMELRVVERIVGVRGAVLRRLDNEIARIEQSVDKVLSKWRA